MSGVGAPGPASAGLPALHVVPGGPARHVDLGRLLLTKVSVSEQDNACYVLTCPATGEQLLVDAADRAPDVLAAVAEAAALAAGDGSRGMDVRAVATTHGHWDHHRALPAVVEATGAAVLVGAADADDLPVPADRLLHHGDEVSFGRVRLGVVHLRGHTPGSVALVLPAEAGRAGLVVTGDSLFPGGVGNTDGDPERFARLLDDVSARLFDVLDDTTLVLPGHGDGTTVGAERPHLGTWRDRGW